MNGGGNNETCIFPNLIFRTKKGINIEPTDKYYYLFELACESASKKMNPTFCSLDAVCNRRFYENDIFTNIMG